MDNFRFVLLYCDLVDEYLEYQNVYRVWEMLSHSPDEYLLRMTNLANDQAHIDMGVRMVLFRMLLLSFLKKKYIDLKNE